ncbi:MAG: HD domain-containing phosphohydrolase [Bacteriovorax sp.]|jgi:HD-GYP domain-containing protein (c-di-GMP phosphodiesterase class II)
MAKIGHNFFSISFDLIAIDRPISYDLYVNSSANENKEKYVRIYPKNDSISFEELKVFKKKYFQLYVHESQREQYLKSLIHCSSVPDSQKSEIIKDSAIHYLDKLFDEDKEFTNEILSETIQGCKTTVESMVDVIKDYDVSKLQSLIGTLSFHDFYTYDHSINVSMYCIALYSAARPNAPKDEIILAGLGGLLHDIGKVKISTDIINNPDKLTDEEFAVIKKHPDYGYNLLVENSCSCEGIDFEIIKRIVHEHHENFNGTGYPKKLAGVDIHLLARVTAIADFFDAVTTKRSYHDVLPTEDAIAVMAKSVGKKLDPDLFEIFTKSVKQLVLTGKSNKELPEDFDPCQPQNILPFRSPKPSFKVEGFSESEKERAFGKIKKRVS